MPLSAILHPRSPKHPKHHLYQQGRLLAAAEVLIWARRQKLHLALRQVRLWLPPPPGLSSSRDR